MVVVEVTDDEAVVLLEFLQRFSDTGSIELQDQAEARALWNLACVLEKTLAPFPEDYELWVANARDRLRDE